DDLAARIDEIGRAVEPADVPRRLGADPVDGADVTAIRGGRGGLFEFPQILAEAGDRRGGIDDILGTVQGETAPALREMPVVADIDAELAIAGLEHRPARIARLEKELLVKAG